MVRRARLGVFLMLSLVLVAGLVLTGCGTREAALQQPGLEFMSYVKGSTVDLDDATLNTMAEGGGEAGYKFGIMKAIYPTVFNDNKDAVAEMLFPPPYKIIKVTDDPTVTTYAMLTEGDKQVVDGTIFATKLTSAEQDIVMDGLAGFFNRQEVDMADAKPLEQNMAYGILAGSVSVDAADAWKADAEAWMVLLEAKAASEYGGKTYAELTLAEKAAVKALAPIIDPETAFYRAMVQKSFRNGTASATYPTIRDSIVASQYPGQTYEELNPMLEAPVVDAMVWAQLTDAQKAVVNDSVAGLFNLAEEQNSAPKPLEENIYYMTLLLLPEFMGGGQAAADAWEAAVEPTTPGTGAEAIEFYRILGSDNVTVGQATWKGILTARYYGDTATYDGLSAAQKAVIDQAADGMMGLAAVQRMDPLPLSMNVLYTSVLAPNIGATAAAGWEADVADGKNMEWMFYKWMVFESFRNGTAASFYPTQVAAKVTEAKGLNLITADTYAECDAYEKAIVNGMVWASLGAEEQGYVQGAAIPGLFGLVQAEMTDAVSLDQTICYLTLMENVSVSAAENWVEDVEGGVHYRQAFYRWLAKEAVREMRAAAVMIQQSVGEFYIEITNPNKYAISIDQMTLFFRTTAGDDVSVDAARQVLEGIWVPAEGEITLMVLAPTKVFNVLVWLSMAGVPDAQSVAGEVWSKIQDGTIEWTIHADVRVSSEDEIQNYSYTLMQ